MDANRNHQRLQPMRDAMTPEKSPINQSISQSNNQSIFSAEELKKKWLSFNHLILLKWYSPTFDFIIFNIWSKNWSTLGDKNRWKEGRTGKFFSQMSFVHFYRIVITKPYLKLELKVFPQKREKRRKFKLVPPSENPFTLEFTF